MIWYTVKTTRPAKFKLFAKKNFKKFKLWLPPKELFEDCLFIQIQGQNKPPLHKDFIFQKLTLNMYRSLTEKESTSIGQDLEVKSKKVIIGKKVKIVSPLVNFNGKVVRVVKDLVYIKGKIFGKEIKLAIPKDYIENYI